MNERTKVVAPTLPPEKEEALKKLYEARAALRDMLPALCPLCAEGKPMHDEVWLPDGWYHIGVSFNEESLCKASDVHNVMLSLNRLQDARLQSVEPARMNDEADESDDTLKRRADETRAILQAHKVETFRKDTLKRIEASIAIGHEAMMRSQRYRSGRSRT